MNIKAINQTVWQNQRCQKQNFKMYSLAFKSKQELGEDTFYIKMDSYNNDNSPRAKEMNKLCQRISKKIEQKEDFNTILDITAKNIAEINKNISSTFGERRYRLTSYYYIDINDKQRGKEYYQKYLQKCHESRANKYKTKANKEYKKAQTCKFTLQKDGQIRLFYGSQHGKWNKNLNLAAKEYQKLINNEKPTLEDILKSAATIQWLIAQSTPYDRGSDSIANIITKSIFRAYDIQISPIKKGRSLDFEAFYRDLDDYINAYPGFFEKPLEFTTT